MPTRAKVFCKHAGCTSTADPSTGYCEAHADEYAAKKREEQRRWDIRRGSAADRGYGYKWRKYSRWFLRQPGHEFCVLHLDIGCAVVAQCVDHIDPPNGRDDPRFWDPANHQPACIHCNSVKLDRNIIGTYKFGFGGDEDGGKTR